MHVYFFNKCNNIPCHNLVKIYSWQKVVLRNNSHISYSSQEPHVVGLLTFYFAERQLTKHQFPVATQNSSMARLEAKSKLNYNIIHWSI